MRVLVVHRAEQSAHCSECFPDTTLCGRDPRQVVTGTYLMRGKGYKSRWCKRCAALDTEEGQK